MFRNGKDCGKAPCVTVCVGLVAHKPLSQANCSLWLVNLVFLLRGKSIVMFRSLDQPQLALFV